MKFSKDGYKRNSKDRNNPYNVIPSGNITMEGVDFPVFGMDNLGNSRVMMPGANYTFPGSSVFEVPLAQGGDEVQEPKFTINKYNQVNTPDKFTNEELFNFIKDKYNTIDTSQQQQDLLEKLRSPVFLDRYKKNWYNITGEELSDEQAINNISQQYEFTSQGAPFHVTFPFVRTNEKGWVQNTTPFINPYEDNKKVRWFNAKGYYIDPPFVPIRDIENPNIPELAQYSFVPFLNKKRIIGWASDQGDDVQPYSDWRDTVVHEYAHSYNTGDSPLFSPLAYDTDYDSVFYFGRPLNDIGQATGMERYRTFISDLFGEDYLDEEKNPYGTWSMQPQEISSIKSETEANLKSAGIWDNTKQEFGMDNLNEMIKKNFSIGDASGLHLRLLGYGDIRDLYSDNKQNKKEYKSALNSLEYIGQKPYRIVDYIKDAILEDQNENGMIIPRTDFIVDRKYGRGSQYQGIDLNTFNEIFLNSQNDIKERNRYETYDDLLNDYNSGKKRKIERAESVLNNIYNGIKTGIDNIYNSRIEEQEIKIEEKKKEILPKMETYFNEIVMDNQGGDDVLARHGKELPKASPGLEFIKNRYPGFNDLTPDEQNQVLSQYSGNEYIPQTQRPPQFSDDYYRVQEFRQNNPNVFGSTIGLGTLPDYAAKSMSRNPMGQIVIDEDMAKRIQTTKGLDSQIAEQFRSMLSGRKSGKTMFVNYNLDDMVNSGAYTYDTPGQGPSGQSMKGYINQAGLNKLIELSGQMNQPNYPQLQGVDTSFTDKELKRIERENYMDPFGDIDPTSRGMINIPQIKEEEENPFLVDQQSAITIPQRTVGNIDLSTRGNIELPPKTQAPIPTANEVAGTDYVPQSRRQSNEYIPQSQRRTGGALFQAQDGDEVAATVTLPEVPISALSLDSEKLLSQSQRVLYDMYKAPDGGIRQTLPIDIGEENRQVGDIHWRDALRMAQNAPDTEIYDRPNKSVDKDKYMIGKGHPDYFRAHANMLSKDIFVPHYNNVFGYDLDDTDRRRQGKRMSSIIAEYGHTSPEVTNPREGFLQTLFDRTKRFIDEKEWPDSSNYKSPGDLEYHTHTAPNSAENQLYDKYNFGRYNLMKPIQKKQDGDEVKFEDLEKGIRYAESLNGELMLNPESTATGLYGQLWSEVKDMYDGTREEFSEDLDYQKKIFKDRANGLIEGIPGLIENGTDIYNEYSDVEHGMSTLEIAALSNMLGRQGTRKYIGNHIRDGKSLADVFPHLYGDDINQTNKTPIEYIEKFNKGLLGLRLGGEIGKKLRRLKQQLKLYNEGQEISGIVKKELMDRGLIQPVVMQTGGSIEPHTVKQGDYLGKIARDRGLSVDEVIALNPKFKDRRSTIYPGEVVYFDEQTKKTAESNEPVLSHTIQKGDTLGEIASKYRVSLAEVAELNNLTGDQINRIYPGDQLIMPKHAQYIKNESTERQKKIAKSPVTTEDTIVINEFNPINEVWVTRERNEDGTYSTVGGKKQRVDEINLYDNYETIINAKNDGDISSSTETYAVKQGDTLGSIAADRDGVTVNSIAYNNNIDNPNNIMVGQKLKIKKSASKPYLIVDKQKGKMHLLYPGEDAPRDSYDILLGTMIGDQATKTITTYSYNGKELSQKELTEHMKDNGVKTISELLKVPGYRQASFDQYGGNRMTGAGKYTISAANPDGGRSYRGDSRGELVPSFNLVSDAGVEQALAIHGVTRSRTSNLYDGIGTNNRLTTGCINGKCVDLQSLYDNPDIGEGTELYILPEKEGSSFVYENGKLNFYTSRKNQETAEEGYYKTKKNQKRFEGKGGDEGEFVEGGPGINVTTDFGNYRPIQFEFDIDSYKNSSIPDGNENNLIAEYQQNTKPFLNALAKNKKPLMDLLNIDGDLYNNIALTAFGIYGNESGMGDINNPIEDFALAGRKFGMSVISDAEYGAGSVVGKYRYANDSDQSVGWTQLRVGYGFTDPRERELLAEADKKFGTNFASPLNGSNGGYDDVRNHPDYNTLSKEDKEKAEKNGYKGGVFLPRDANGMPIKGMSTQYHMYKIDNSELMDQEKSALATMILLTNRYQTQIDIEEKNAPGFDIFNRLPLTWRPTGSEQTRQNYVNLVNKNMQFVNLIESDIKDFDENVISKGSFIPSEFYEGVIPMGKKFKRGGEFGLDKQVQFYEDYVNDLYKNTNQEKSANKLYDKLNRMYYNDSRGTGGNTLDTMRAMNEQSNN